MVLARETIGRLARSPVIAAAAETALGTGINPDKFGGRVVEGGYFIPDAALERIFPGDLREARKRLRMVLADLHESEPATETGPVAKPPNVRIATAEDELAIFELLMVMLRENAEQVAPIDEDKVIEAMRLGTHRKGGIVAVIDGPDGLPVATCGYISEEWWWSRQRHWVQVWDFVHPDHRRGSDHIDALIQFGKWIGDHSTKKYGYRLYVLFGVLAAIRTMEKVRLYRRKVRQIGASFMYPFPKGS